MTNVIAYHVLNRVRRNNTMRKQTNNVVSLAEWQKTARPLRTPHGVHFVTGGITRPVYCLTLAADNPQVAA